MATTVATVGVKIDALGVDEARRRVEAFDQELRELGGKGAPGLDASRARVETLLKGLESVGTRSAAVGKLRDEEALLASTLRAGNLTFAERIRLTQQLDRVQVALAQHSTRAALGQAARGAAGEVLGGVPGVGGALSQLTAGGVTMAAGIGAAVLAAGAAIRGAVGVLKDSVAQAADAEAKLADLQGAVANAGQSYDAWGPKIDRTVERLQRLTTVEDDQARGVLARMVVATGDVAGSVENLGLVADIAAARHIDLEAAADAVSKAMNGQVTALNRMGFAGKDATTVLENARRATEGFAERGAKTLSGRLAQLANEWGNLKEELGGAILGSDNAADSIGKLTDLLRDGQAWVRAHRMEIQSLASAFASVAKFVAEATVQTARYLANVQKFGLFGGTVKTAIDAGREAGAHPFTAAEPGEDFDATQARLRQKLRSTGTLGAVAVTASAELSAEAIQQNADALKAVAEARRLTNDEAAFALRLQRDLNAELAKGTPSLERQKEIHAQLKTLKEALGAADKAGAEAEDKRQAAQREAVAALTTLVDLGVARASDVAMGVKLEQQLRAELDRGVASLKRQAELEQLINALLATRPKRAYPTGDQSAEQGARGAAAASPAAGTSFETGASPAAAGVASDMDALSRGMKAQVGAVVESVNATVAEFDLRDSLAGTLAAGIAGGLGDGIAAGFAALPRGGIAAGFKALTGSLLSGLGAAMVQFGKASLFTAKLMEAIKKALASFLPGGAVTASIAMIAAGAMLQGAASSAFGGGGGGGGGAGSGGDVSIERTRDREDRYTIGTTAGAVGRSGMASAVQPPESLTRVPVAVRAGAAAEAASAPPSVVQNFTVIGERDVAAQRTIARMTVQGLRDAGVKIEGT